MYPNSESYEYWITVNGCVDHECHVNVDSEGNHLLVREQLETIGKLNAELCERTHGAIKARRDLEPDDAYFVELFELHHSHGRFANEHTEDSHAQVYGCECAQYAQDHRPIAEWASA
jgi:hypothetical protein